MISETGDQKQTFLLAGQNGGNLDTLILAQVNPAKKQVTLLSIPRDLFYDGRKINSVYIHFGMGELKRQLSAITGQTIDHSAVINVDALIEVIDALGGIDVYLDKAVVDPSYKTFDYGQWGTLHYPAGLHHFSGTQAMRLIRSRHFSSDFARAERQHLVLEGIQKKVRELDILDSYKVSKIIGLVLRKTVTDIDLREALSFYWQFKDYKIKSGFVLSTLNVLTSTMQPVEADPTAPTEKCEQKLAGTDKVIEVSCAPASKGQYILLPKKDWAAVKAYVNWLLKQ